MTCNLGHPMGLRQPVPGITPHILLHGPTYIHAYIHVWKWIHITPQGPTYIHTYIHTYIQTWKSITPHGTTYILTNQQIWTYITPLGITYRHTNTHHVSLYVCMTYKHTSMHTCMNTHHAAWPYETWGAGVVTRRNTKNRVPLCKKDPKKNVISPGACYSITGTRFPCYISLSTIWWARGNGNLLVQIEPKIGFESETVKNGYRQSGYLPPPPKSRPCIHTYKYEHTLRRMALHTYIHTYIQTNKYEHILRCEALHTYIQTSKHEKVKCRMALHTYIQTNKHEHASRRMAIHTYIQTN